MKETITLAELRADPRNARRHTERNQAAVSTSIQEVGFTRPLVAANDGTIIGGNLTAEVLADLGMEDVIVVRSDGTKAIVHIREDVEPGSPEAIKAGLYDNMAADLADGYHEDVLAALLQEVELAPVVLTQREAERLLAGATDAGGTEGQTDPDAIPEPTEQQRTQAGDVWRLGDHVLVCGDATDADDVALACAGALPDLMLTDPPYGVGYVGKTADALTIENDEVDDPATRRLVADAMRAAPLRPGAAFYVFSPAGNTETTFRLAIADAGYELRQCLVWVKHHFVMGRQDYHWRHESILYGWRAGAAHYFVADRGLDTVIDDDLDLEQLSKQELLSYARQLHEATPTTVLREDRPHRSSKHPTMKPVALVRRLMRHSSRVGDTVYEPFCGSGSTFIAAEQEGRVCRGLEILPRYCDVAVQRWEEFTGRTAQRERRPC